MEANYNEEDRKFFDKAVLAIVSATINNEYTEDSLITRAFELARKMTVQLKNEMYNHAFHDKGDTMRPCLLCEERGTIADRRCPYCKGKGQKPDVASDEVLKAYGIDPEIPKLFDELNRKKRKMVLWLHEQKADPDVIDTVLRM